ncbi:hypothetical protein CEXT_96571 [Caerostris extrusa]|uniref:Uncharacterized protein n=1 Tax=Caerostris extrusa TaxID=172846 RepID=A0AAV4SWR0_CAEEX|nr:hypothetical protein CEXT_96571 [Caerostris extrusa]
MTFIPLLRKYDIYMAYERRLHYRNLPSCLKNLSISSANPFQSIKCGALITIITPQMPIGFGFLTRLQHSVLETNPRLRTFTCHRTFWPR